MIVDTILFGWAGAFAAVGVGFAVSPVFGWRAFRMGPSLPRQRAMAHVAVGMVFVGMAYILVRGMIASVALDAIFATAYGGPVAWVVWKAVRSCRRISRMYRRSPEEEWLRQSGWARNALRARASGRAKRPGG